MAYNFISPTRPDLRVNRGDIPADGATFVGCTFADLGPSPHLWSVNGAVTSVPAVRDAVTGLWISEAEVTAAQAGPVEISVNGQATQVVQAL